MRPTLAALLVALSLAGPAAAQGGAARGDRQAILETISRAVETAVADEAEAFGQLWNVDRMVTHLEWLLGPDAAEPLDKGPILVGFRIGLRIGVRDWRENFLWAEHQVLRVERDPGAGEATAIVRFRDLEGDVDRVRLWLVRNEGGWRLWDQEYMSVGLRLSSLCLPFLVHVLQEESPAEHPLPEWFEALEELLAGLNASAEGDYEGCRTALRATDGVEFPETIAALRVVLATTLDVADGRYAEATARLDEAGELDIPLLDLLAAAAHNELGQHERALEHARRFLAVVGEDPQGRRHEGTALMGLGRDEEAVLAFRAGLDEDPSYLELLYRLGRALPPGGKDELGPRLVATGDPAGSFEPVVTELLERDETEAVAVLVEALREALPGDPNADYYEATLLARRGRHAEAAALLADALPRVDDPEELPAYEREYLRRMADAGAPLEGYEHLEGSDHAFEELAPWLYWYDNGAALLELTRRHGERAPGHPRLALARARALALLERREEAETAFAEAMERAGEDELDDVRYERVLNLFEAGAWRRAYVEVLPAGSAFADLAWLMEDEGDLDGLEELVGLHREAGADDDDLDLAYWSVELAWLRGRHEATLEQLRAREAVLCTSEDVSDLYYWEDRFVRCCLRLGRLDEATQRALAIDERDDDPFYTALAHAAAGREEEAASALRRALDQGWVAEQLYTDEDLGPLLRAEGADALRAVVPPPEEGPSRG